MVDALLDTATIIDLLRGYPPAISWFSQSEQLLGISKFVWMEVVDGCINKDALRKATHLITQLDIIVATENDIDWALEKMIQYNLSHNIDPLDCLIGATAWRLQIPLYTRNLKHFRPLINDLASSPY